MKNNKVYVIPFSSIPTKLLLRIVAAHMRGHNSFDKQIREASEMLEAMDTEENRKIVAGEK